MEEIISHYNKMGSNVHMYSLDATKAFDNVNFSKLFQLLLKGEEHPKHRIVLWLVLDLYPRPSVTTTWTF